MRLRPAPHSRTPIEAYSLRVEPADHFINWQQDALGNFLARLVFPNPTRQLTITVGLIADLKVINPFDFFIEDWAETWPPGSTTPRRSPTTSSRTCGRSTKAARARARGTGAGVGARTSRSRRRHPHHRLPGRAQPGGQRRRRLQPADGTRRADTGFHAAHRHRLVPRLGVAAGVDPAPARVGRPLRVRLPGAAGLRRRGARRAVRARRRLHRPARVGRGVHPRRGLDRAGPDVGAVRRRGPHPAGGHAAPRSRGADQRRHRARAKPRWSSPTPSPACTRIRASRCPTPTRPGQTICDVGARVDERLAAGDVRLTVGGEPTFVSVDNQVDEEWTIAADGPHKRAAGIRTGGPAEGGVGTARADPARPGQVVSGRAVAALADWAVLAHRRASRCGPTTRCWPTRGRTEPTARHRDDEAGLAAARRASPTGLGLPLSQVRPAYEDPLARLAAKSGMPEGDPVAPDDDLGRPTTPAAGRAALLARLEEIHHGPGGVRAAAAPPRRRPRLGQRRLAAAPRPHRAARGRFAGGSAAAAGLDQLAARHGRPSTPTRWPSATRCRRRPRPRRARLDDAETAPIDRDGRRGPRRAAVRLHAAHRGARALRRPHRPGRGRGGEGRLPGRDRGLRPTAGSAAAVDDDHPRPRRHRGQRRAHRQLRRAEAQQLETLYEQARLARLSTESFDVDGTHGGTGGGNHITLGGITPADSPLLRRPDLLVSLLTYWQRHPSLSYLFAGRFVGTTSQAPRVDEGRAECALRTRDRVRRDRPAGFAAKDGSAPSRG